MADQTAKPVRGRFTFKPAEGQSQGDYVELNFNDLAQFNTAVYEASQAANGRATVECAGGAYAYINTAQLLYAALIEN